MADRHGPRTRIAAAFAVLARAGCWSVRFEAQGRSGGQVHTRALPFFVHGLIGDHEVDLDALCPRRVATFRVEASFVDAVLSVVTLGIYTPRTAIVECAAR